jgi:RNA polymerase sigma-70 factor (ECF subfamily)
MSISRRFPWPRLAHGREPARGEGENAALFRQVILPHLDAAYRYACWLGRDPVSAEDVVQEAFLRAYRSAGQCRGDGKSWLLAIVRNCHHDLVRTNSRYRSGEGEPGEEGLAERPDWLAERDDAIAHLRQTIAALPDPFRETILLREIEELSYREIADLTGVPIGTVMSRLARAREMLAKLMLGGEAQRSKGEAR